MKGTIRSYSSAAKAGLIECIEGNKYQFSAIDWQDPAPPYIGQPVIFIPTGNKALGVTQAAASAD